jgi:hypothetical protein
VAYKNRALAALHTLNNWHHVVGACEASHELRAVAEGWVEKNKVQGG